MSQFNSNSIFWVEVNKVHSNPYQPRKEFDEDKLNELAESLRQYGVLQPLVVTKKEVSTEDGGIRSEYEIIAGERRLRAAHIAGLQLIPVIIRSGEDDSKTKLEIAIIENLQREDLNPIDRAQAFNRLAEEFNFKHSQIAQKVGKSREYVSNSMRLLSLPEEMRSAIADGRVPEGHARSILMLNDKPEEQQTLFKEIIYKKITAREAERIARKSAQEKVRKHKKNEDPQLVEMEKQLAESLGTRVQIEKRQVGGKLVIDYFSNEDLQELIDFLKAQNAPQKMVDKFIQQQQAQNGDGGQSEESITYGYNQEPSNEYNPSSSNEVEQQGSSFYEHSGEQNDVYNNSQEVGAGFEQGYHESSYGADQATESSISEPGSLKGEAMSEEDLIKKGYIHGEGQTSERTSFSSSEEKLANEFSEASKTNEYEENSFPESENIRGHYGNSADENFSGEDVNQEWGYSRTFGNEPEEREGADMNQDISGSSEEEGSYANFNNREERGSDNLSSEYDSYGPTMEKERTESYEEPTPGFEQTSDFVEEQDFEAKDGSEHENEKGYFDSPLTQDEGQAQTQEESYPQQQEAGDNPNEEGEEDVYSVRNFYI